MSRVIILLVLLAVTHVPAFAFQGGPTIRGKISYQSRPPENDFLVELQTQDRRVVLVARLRGDNDFHFQGITGGHYFIHVKVDGYVEVQQSLEVMGGPNFVDIVLRETDERVRSRGGFVGDNPNVVDIAALAAKHPEEAVEEYEKSLDDIQKEDTKRAIERLEKAVRLAPDFFQARNNLGLQYQKQRRFEDAESEFRQAHALNRSEAQPLINLGNLWLEQDDFAPAAVVLREAVRLAPSSAAAHYYLGSALYKTAALEEAESFLIRALELETSPGSRLMLVNVYMQQQRYKPALEQLDWYLEDSPDGEDRKAVEEMRDRILELLEG
jgi:Tfp pilus assembly protein PilF